MITKSNLKKVLKLDSSITGNTLIMKEMEQLNDKKHEFLKVIAEAYDPKIEYLNELAKKKAQIVRKIENFYYPWHISKSIPSAWKPCGSQPTEKHRLKKTVLNDLLQFIEEYNLFYELNYEQLEKMYTNSKMSERWKREFLAELKPVYKEFLEKNIKGKEFTNYLELLEILDDVLIDYECLRENPLF